MHSSIAIFACAPSKQFFAVFAMAAFPQLELTCTAMSVAMANNVDPELRRLRLRNASQTLEIERLRMQVADLQQAQMSHWFTGERQLTWREFALQRQGRVSQLLFWHHPTCRGEFANCARHRQPWTHHTTGT